MKTRQTIWLKAFLLFFVTALWVGLIALFGFLSLFGVCGMDGSLRCVPVWIWLGMTLATVAYAIAGWFVLKRVS